MTEFVYTWNEQLDEIVLEERPVNEKANTTNGLWLAGNTKYYDVVQKALEADPGLKDADWNKYYPEPSRLTEAAVLDFDDNGGSISTTFERSQVPDFVRHLRSKTWTNDQGVVHQPIRRFCILEGLSPTFVDALGSHYNIHPSLFKLQERSTAFSLDHESTNDNFELPSILVGRKSFHLRYYELLHFDSGLPLTYAACADTRRHIANYRYKTKPLSTGIVRRKCTFWSRQCHSNCCWEAVLLCDPPVRHYFTGEIQRRNAKVNPCSTRPFQGGYKDFMPRDTAEDYLPQDTMGRTGPARTSLLEDISFYSRAYGYHFTAQNSPDFLALFVKKVVAAQYLELLSYMRAYLSHLTFTLTRRDAGFDDGDRDWIECEFSDVQQFSLRCSQYIQDMEANQIDLGIPLDRPVTHVSGNDHEKTWKACEIDYKWIYSQLSTLQVRIDSLGNSISGFAGIAGNRLAFEGSKRSLRETQRAKTLTLIGLVFIPLAYVTSLFSMNDDYQPSGPSFKIYFAVALPLVVVVVLFAFLLDLGYGDDAKWSFSVVGAKVQRWKTKLDDRRRKPKIEPNSLSLSGIKPQ